MRSVLLGFAIAGLTLLGACSSSPEGPSAETTNTNSSVTASNTTNNSGAKLTDVVVTDAMTGKPFKLSDLAGKTVLVEPMATWCPKCKTQLQNVKQARTELGDQDYAFVAISVEPDLPRAELAQYAKAEGFDWTFAIATPEMLQALEKQFGQTAVAPPATPHFIIKPNGEVSDLSTGAVAPDALIARLKQASGK